MPSHGQLRATLQTERMSFTVASVTHHESAHAVAALMTVNRPIGDTTVGVRNGLCTGHVDVHPVGPPTLTAFIVYAGPWAEARLQWGKPAEAREQTGASGATFRELVAAAFSEGAGGEADRSRYAELCAINPAISGYESLWLPELERAWPVISKLARRLRELLAGTVPTEVAVLGGTQRSLVVPAGDVIALVRPPLEELGQWRYLTHGPSA